MSIVRASSLAVTVAIAIAAVPEPAPGAQNRMDGPPRATLRGWEEAVRLAIVDRAGSAFGRASERGILQRFNETMDSEYDLDVISSSFGMSEVYEWYQRDAGARYWAGSIDHLRMIQLGEMKASVGLGENWAADVHFTLDESLTNRRSLLRLGLSHEFSAGRGSVFAQGTLRSVKPETDIEFGSSWAVGGGRVTVAVAALDLFSDAVYQGLGVASSIADSALDYTSHPFTGRIALDAPVGEDWRIEAYALLLVPTAVIVESQTVPGEGFSQEEGYGYVGGLLEFNPSGSTAVGTFATWVRARLDRSPLAAGQLTDDYRLTEITSSVGLYAIHRFRRRLGIEGWLARTWRTEDRVRRGPPIAPDLEYEDRTWAGRWSVTYYGPGGFRAMPGLDFTARSASEPQPVQTREPLARDHVRVRGDVGWRFEERSFLVVGANFDLDDGSFDGAHGRFALYW